MTARPHLRAEARALPDAEKTGFVLSRFVRTLRKRARNSLADQPDQAPPAAVSQASRPASARRFMLRAVLLLAFVSISVPQIFSAEATVASYDFSQNAASLAAVSDTLFDPSSAPEPVGEAGLQIVQRNFDPVLVERLESLGVALPGLAEPGSPSAPLITNEMLRVIAKMSPEQIDALTLLLLAQQGPATAPSAAQLASATSADTSIWVGDWQDIDGNLESLDAAPGASSATSEFLQSWRLVEVSTGSAMIQNGDELLSAIAVVPGTILGSLGTVTDITIEDGFASVLLSSGAEIFSDLDTVFSEDPAAVDQTDITAAPAEEAEAPATEEGEAAAAAPPVADQPEPELALPATPAPAPSDPPGDGLFIQVGTFKSEENAGVALKMLAEQGLGGNVFKAGQGGSAWHRVVAGPVAQQDVQTTLALLSGIGFKDAFVAR